MPVTAKLSKKFYDKLGDEVTNELVEWLNTVDTSYRQEFRELFDAHFGRLDARLDAAEARSEGRFAAFEARFGTLEARVDSKLANSEKSLIRWMFGFWIGSWVVTIGTLVAAHQLWGAFGR